MNENTIAGCLNRVLGARLVTPEPPFSFGSSLWFESEAGLYRIELSGLSRAITADGKWLYSEPEMDEHLASLIGATIVRAELRDHDLVIQLSYGDVIEIIGDEETDEYEVGGWSLSGPDGLRIGQASWGGQIYCAAGGDG